MNSLVHFSVVTTEDGVCAIREAWNDLHARCGNSIFFDGDSFLIWWRTVGRSSRSLHIVVGHEDGKLVAVLPLVVLRKKGMRVLQMAGEKAFATCDLIAEPHIPSADVWRAALRSPSYHFADIRDVFEGTACHAALSAFARRRDASACLHMDIVWKSGKDWFAERSKTTRYNFSRNMRRLEETGPVTFNAFEALPLPEGLMDRLVTLKTAWCLENREHGLFDHPGVGEFYRQLAAHAAAKGWLALSCLSCGDQPIGFDLAFRYKNALSGFVTTYDPAWSACSPGILVLTHSMMWAIDQGITRYDFRQGDYPYKHRFTNSSRACFEYTFSGNLMGRLVEEVFVNARGIHRWGKKALAVLGERWSAKVPVTLSAMFPVTLSMWPYSRSRLILEALF